MVPPGVAMGVEMHAGQRLATAVLGFRGAQQREGDRMVATEEHAVVPRHQRGGLGLDVAAHLGQRRGIGQAHVQRIAQVVQRRDIEMRVDAIAQHQAGRADGLRPEARPGSVGHHPIEGHARDGKGLVGQGLAGQETVAVVGVGKLTHGHGEVLVKTGGEEVAPEGSSSRRQWPVPIGPLRKRPLVEDRQRSHAHTWLTMSLPKLWWRSSSMSWKPSAW